MIKVPTSRRHGWWLLLAWAALCVYLSAIQFGLIAGDSLAPLLGSICQCLAPIILVVAWRMKHAWATLTALAACVLGALVFFPAITIMLFQLGGRERITTVVDVMTLLMGFAAMISLLDIPLKLLGRERKVQQLGCHQVHPAITEEALAEPDGETILVMEPNREVVS